MITNVQLTTKERFLLEDARSHEEQCILKYQNYANLATDTTLKDILRKNGKNEEEHLQTINQLLSGKVPAMGGQSYQSSNQSNQTSSLTNQKMQAGTQTQQQAVEQKPIFNASDKDLCTDLLNTEKYVSATYNTAIFEFKDAQVRDVLNHIQTEEQKHGEAIFAYMQSKGMYKPQ